MEPRAVSLVQRSIVHCPYICISEGSPIEVLLYVQHKVHHPKKVYKTLDIAKKNALIVLSFADEEEKSQKKRDRERSLTYIQDS